MNKKPQMYKNIIKFKIKANSDRRRLPWNIVQDTTQSNISLISLYLMAGLINKLQTSKVY